MSLILSMPVAGGQAHGRYRSPGRRSSNVWKHLRRTHL